MREAAAHSLGQLDTEECFSALRQQLDDSDPDVVAAVIQALKNTGEPSRRQRLVDELAAAPLREWQGLMAALMAMDDDALDSALLSACRMRLVDANRYIVVLNAARQWARDGASELLADQLYAEVQAVCDTTVRVLGHLGDTGVVGDLVERLGGNDAAARDNAIELLENIAEGDLLTCLLPLLESDEGEQLHRAQSVVEWEGVEVEEGLSLPAEQRRRMDAGCHCLGRSAVGISAALRRGWRSVDTYGPGNTKRNRPCTGRSPDERRAATTHDHGKDHVSEGIVFLRVAALGRAAPRGAIY